MSYISFANFVTLIPMEEKNNLFLWVQNPPFFLLSSGKIERNKKKLLMCLYQQFETAFSTGKVTQNKNTYLLSGSSGSDFGHSCLLRIQKDFLYT